MFRMAIGSTRGSLPPKEGDLTYMNELDLSTFKMIKQAMVSLMYILVSLGTVVNVLA